MIGHTFGKNFLQPFFILPAIFYIHVTKDKGIFGIKLFKYEYLIIYNLNFFDKKEQV